MTATLAGYSDNGAAFSTSGGRFQYRALLQAEVRQQRRVGPGVILLAREVHDLIRNELQRCREASLSAPVWIPTAGFHFVGVTMV
jgi:hypothetical protein